MVGQSEFFGTVKNTRERRDNVDLQIRKLATAFSALRDPTPGDITDYWQERLTVLASRVRGLSLDVPACNRSQDEIRDLRAEGRTLVVNLPELTLEILGMMHHNLAGHWSVQPSN